MDGSIALCPTFFFFVLGEDLYSLNTNEYKETWPQRLQCKWLADVKPFPLYLSSPHNVPGFQLSGLLTDRE